jgi:hypothetical protein
MLELNSIQIQGLEQNFGGVQWYLSRNLGWINLWTWCRASWTRASSGAPWTAGQRWWQACRSAALLASPWLEYRREGLKRWRGRRGTHLR